MPSTDMDRDRLFVSAMGLVPKKSLSRTVRSLAQIRSAMAVRRFAARYKVRVDEAEKPLEAYSSVLDFFTRRLRPGSRPLDEGALISPVDGVVDARGTITEGRMLQAKGKQYTLAELLGDADRAERYEGGSYVTIYLSPKDYHRVHAPVTGKITATTHIPGALYPVNPMAVRGRQRLFSTNERVVTRIETERFGTVESIMVGATCVGHMRVAYDDTIVTNTGQTNVRVNHYPDGIPIERGEELGVFEMGSTVILVTEPGISIADLGNGAPIRMGERLGQESDAEIGARPN